MSLSDRLHRAAPPKHRSVSIGAVETISDIDRILKLPQRPPVICEVDPRTGKYPPATEALMQVMTEKFSRGERLSCACRERRVSMLADGSLVVSRVFPEDEAPEPPIVT